MKAPNKFIIICLLLILAGIAAYSALPKDSLLDTAKNTLATKVPTKKIVSYPGPRQFIDPYPGPVTSYPSWTPAKPVVYVTSEPYYTPYWTPYPRPTLPWGNILTETPEPSI